MSVNVEAAASADARRTTPGASAVRLDSVSRTFQLKDRPLVALENITLEIQKGEFVALVGPSGCGKSTLLRILAGLVPPSTGEVSIFGAPPQNAIRQRAVGFVFQNPVLMPWRSVTSNLRLPLEIARTASAESDRRIQELIELVGLKGFEDARPAQLSGGMRQRAALARALIGYPKLLLLDEPFGALDEITRQRMNLELLRIWREVGVTSVLVTHSVSEAVFLARRVLVMSPRPGRIAHVIDVELGEMERRVELLHEPAFFARCAAVSDALHQVAQSSLEE